MEICIYSDSPLVRTRVATRAALQLATEVAPYVLRAWKPRSWRSMIVDVSALLAASSTLVVAIGEIGVMAGDFVSLHRCTDVMIHRELRYVRCLWNFLLEVEFRPCSWLRPCETLFHLLHCTVFNLADQGNDFAKTDWFSRTTKNENQCQKWTVISTPSSQKQLSLVLATTDVPVFCFFCFFKNRL